MLGNHSESKILIIDSMEYNCMLISEILKAEGYNNIQSVNTGNDAYELLKSDSFELVLLDLAIPDVSGLEICKFIKNHEAKLGTAIIIQTANTNDSTKREAFESGANDFIAKPIEKVELVTRVKLHLDQRELYKQVYDAYARMAHELDDARKMLFMMLPTEESLNKVSEDLNVFISSYYKPSSELGGDFYDLAVFSDNKFAFYIWDFAGHGVGAAINTFRLNSIIKENIKSDITPSKFMTKINNQLHDLIPIGQFATMFYGVFDMKNSTLSYSCASCPQPLLVNFKDKKYQLIDTKNFPLGIQNTIPYEQNEVSIDEWDVLILYSDALTESPDLNGEFLTIENVGDIVLDKSNGEHISTEEIKSIIMDRFSRKYIEGLSDDLTLNIISLRKKDSNSVKKAV